MGCLCMAEAGSFERPVSRGGGAGPRPTGCYLLGSGSRAPIAALRDRSSLRQERGGARTRTEILKLKLGYHRAEIISLFN
ncbi:hypothetical protein AV530_012006 [Patagioenas fasciata monilis]|uniref:Uncharacterized protein n=1 Tax=Patagioenas fasciata monilis TaxID=372326 RepID=A0A1V4JUL2_PATFA|nr:hypothetical protein AV530_012006 [Patagioenas fasciata monilis]